jgi:hypothetical protein
MKTIRFTTLIMVSPPVVWDILMDFKSYGKWNPFIYSIEGIPKPGENIVVTFRNDDGSPGRKFMPEVIKVRKDEEFRWKGRLFMPGIFDGEHSFELIGNGNTTILVHAEKFQGILVPFLSRMLDTKVLDGFQSMNLKIKELAELRGEPSETRS